MMKKIKARIISIEKNQILGSKSIWAKLELEGNDSKVIEVRWGQTPTLFGITGVWRSKAIAHFSDVWEECENNDEVYLYHFADANFNFFHKI